MMFIVRKCRFNLYKDKHCLVQIFTCNFYPKDALNEIFSVLTIPEIVKTAIFGFLASRSFI